MENVLKYVWNLANKLRSRATRSEHMLKNTAFYSISANNNIYD